MIKEKPKICGICHTEIDTKKEYCEFRHYSKKDKIKSVSYYHVVCYRERLSGSHVQAMVANRAMEILDKVGMRVS